MKRISILIYGLFSLLTAYGRGGEQILPLEGNPVLMTPNVRKELLDRQRQLPRGHTISLPFFDDFYASGPYPDPVKWIGNDVYINATYPISPPSINVATFDGIRADGSPYSTAINAIGFCDSLRSQPFNLSGLSNADDIFLSFFFQSQGYGEMPDRGFDFLKVDYLNQTGTWVEQWRGEADSVRPFKQFFLPVKDGFLYDGFQFRFIRFGRLTGNVDHFHIDYVRLDKDRDTIFEKNITDMAYQSMPSGLLKSYYVMPYSQFDTADLSNQHNVVVRNNFINFTTDIVDFWDANEVASATPLGNFNGPSRDFLALTDNPISYNIFEIPTTFTGDTVRVRVDYSFDCSAESALSPEIKANNFISREQVFSNFFAYDDGTAELAYRIEDAPGAKIAVKYHMNKPDTLRAVKFHVANYNTNLSQAIFSVVVWKGLGTGGESDTILYKEDFVKVADLKKEAGNGLNDFSYYALKKEFITEEGLDELIIEGDYYVGFVLTNTGIMNFGFDINTDGSAQHFVNYGAVWEKSLFKGSIMINPVIGKELPWQLTPVNEYTSLLQDFIIYPNPSSSLIYLKYGQIDARHVKVIDMTGKIALTQDLYGNMISIRDLAPGMYTAILENKDKIPVAQSRFLIQH